MGEKFKVYNRARYTYSVLTANKLWIQIKPGSFALLTEDDIAYIESICSENKKPFATKILEVEEKKKPVLENLGITEAETNVLLSDDEIVKRLKGNNATMKKYLSSLTSHVARMNTATVAKGLDLPASKIKMLEEYIPGFNMDE